MERSGAFGMFVKICGLNTEASVQAAVEAGADALGFVFADSPRQVTPARAAELTRNLPPGVAKVAVMLHPTAPEWNAVRDEFGPDWLQTDAEDFSALEVPETIGCFPVYRDRQSADLSVGQNICCLKACAVAWAFNLTGIMQHRSHTALV